MNKVVFITGARRGLGASTAFMFAKKGYDVIINDMYDLEILEDIKSKLESNYGINCMICFGDVSDEATVKRLLNQVKEKYNTLDCLVNNAAIVTDTELENRSIELFDETIHNNINSTYLMCYYFGRFMYESNKISRIVNISSTNGINCNFPTSIDYDASKAAVISLTHNFAIEYAPKILVNAIAPAWINTEMNMELPQELIDEETSKIYLKRFAEPEEVASFIYYIGSEENTYINNQALVIDGGY